MKYALLIYDTQDGWERLSEDEQATASADYRAVSEASGVYGGAQLQPVATAVTVRGSNGDTVTSDGPFVEAKEFLGGYYLVEADDLEGALALARRVPAVRMGGAVEVRPIVER